MRMIQRGEKLSLALEAFHPLDIFREIPRKHFDRDVALQLAIARAVDLPHAPSANGSDDLVDAELRAFRE